MKTPKTVCIFLFLSSFASFARDWPVALPKGAIPEFAEWTSDLKSFKKSLDKAELALDAFLEADQFSDEDPRVKDVAQQIASLTGIVILIQKPDDPSRIRAASLFKRLARYRPSAAQNMAMDAMTRQMKKEFSKVAVKLIQLHRL